MEELILIERSFDSKDWATYIFLLSFSIIVLNKNIFEIRFYEFVRLAFSAKYSKIYKDSSSLRDSFTFSFFVVQIISISFFIQIFLKTFGYINSYSFLSFLGILNLLLVFILSMFLIEKIVAVTFGIEEFVDQFHLQKVTYRNYIAMLFLPIVVILFYNNINSKVIVFTILFVSLMINLLLFLRFLKENQKLIVSKLFYFILYLCTLEIAPYFFLYYWYTKY